MSWFRRHAQVLSPVIQKNIESVAQLEQEFAGQRTPLDRLTDAISNFAGNIKFVIAHAVFLISWFLLNSPWVLGRYAFDPYPYVFLNLVLAVEAVFLGTFVLMSQNRQSRQADQRANID